MRDAIRGAVAHVRGGRGTPRPDRRASGSVTGDPRRLVPRSRIAVPTTRIHAEESATRPTEERL